MDMMIIASIVLLAIVIVVAYKGLKSKQQVDSALKRRAVFNSTEQMTFTRLKEILPEANILAHVSFDALLTTKYPHTRRKYSKMFADFVILDQDCKVLAIITLNDINMPKRANDIFYQDAMLEMAGYRIVHYMGVPEYSELREDFLTELADMHSSLTTSKVSASKFSLYSKDTDRMKAFS